MSKTDDALLLVGQITGLAFRLDVPTLAKFLTEKPKDFRYTKECEAVIQFRNAVFPTKGK